jgi:hypothetical protein
MQALKRLPAENAWTIWFTAPILATRAQVSPREERLRGRDKGGLTRFNDGVLMLPP